MNLNNIFPKQYTKLWCMLTLIKQTHPGNNMLKKTHFTAHLKLFFLQTPLKFVWYTSRFTGKVNALLSNVS